jgi:CheY-like chemotaxis protein
MPTTGGEAFFVMIADDSEDDCRLLKRAFQDCGLPQRLEFAKDGQELLDSLRAKKGASLPGLLLLDLSMPRVDGKEALKAIRGDKALSLLPVVVLSTSNYREDVMQCYMLGANSVITKPPGYREFVDMIQSVMNYWTRHVLIPAHFA